MLRPAALLEVPDEVVDRGFRDNPADLLEGNVLELAEAQARFSNVELLAGALERVPHGSDHGAPLIWKLVQICLDGGSAAAYHVNPTTG